jgi:peptidyl-prolyl cis-trans isomerase A (cyclophilin A)
MRNRWNFLVASWTVVALIGTWGCGGGGDPADGKTPATTAINGSEADPASATAGSKTDKAKQDALHPIVVLETTLGKITLQLDAEKTPLTVDNFLYYVNNGFYDQTIFHQIVKGDIVLAGGYTADLKDKPTRRTGVFNEAHKGLKNLRGSIAMVRQPDSVGSATSQFFLNLADNPRLDYQGRTADKYGYCVFGRVIEGQEVLDKIGDTPVEDKGDFQMKPVKTVLINSAKRIR